MSKIREYAAEMVRERYPHLPEDQRDELIEKVVTKLLQTRYKCD